MENYKVKVSNEAESKEVQELLFSLGYYWAYKDIGKNFYYKDGDVHLYANKNGMLATGVISQTDFFNNWSGEELTIPELRQLASRESLNDTYAEIEQVRKEYLDSAKNYTYVQDTAKRSEDWIEIPEGAEVATFNGGQLVFWKNNGELSYSMDFSSYWERLEDGLSTLKEYTDYYGDHVVWSRYTQPDPLPFIDDNPLDVESVLNERGSRYGDFSDVSDTTMQLMSIVESARNYEHLEPYQKTALFMIFNKIARAVNGDPKYLDNYTDIAGYATLVIQELSRNAD